MRTSPETTGVPIVFADSETDSLDPRTRQPWDIALIRREPDGTETEHQFYVELDLSKSDPFALKIGKFWQRNPMGRHYSGAQYGYPQALDNGGPRVSGYFEEPIGQLLTRRAAAQRIALVTHGAHIVGAIPSFDTITMEPLLWEAGLMGTWHHHIIDVEALAVGYLRGRAFERDLTGFGASDPRVRELAPPWKSDDLHYLLGLEPLAEEDRHTALGDARWARSFYDQIMGTPARADEGVRAEGARA